MQLTGQNWFTRSFLGGYKMTNDSCVRIYAILLRMEGEAIKESVFRGHHIILQGSRGWRIIL